jgi:8-oxo-dGTP pyrophosphatase MutT (NUDIX family)
MTKIFFGNRIFAISDDAGKCFNLMNGIGARTVEPSEAVALFDIFERSPQIPELWVYHENPDTVLREIASCNKFLRAAGGLVFNKSGQKLLIHRSGFWDLPKGKAEKDESEQQTAIREVEEECGLHNPELKHKIKNTYHVYRMAGTRILKETAWYEMYYSGNEPLTPQTDEDIDKAEWVDADKLHKYDKMYASIKDLMGIE